MSDRQISNFATFVQPIGIIKRSRIPELHTAHKPATGVHPKFDAALAECRAKLAAGGLVVLVGNRGTGKTQIAAMVANDLAISLSGMRSDDTPVVYRTAKEMLAEIRIGMNETGRMPDRFTKAELLIVDEIQVRSETEDQRDNLTLLIDKRYGAMKPTLLIGNIKAGELQTALGTSILDRTRDGGRVIVCDWESFRGAA